LNRDGRACPSWKLQMLQIVGKRRNCSKDSGQKYPWVVLLGMSHFHFSCTCQTFKDVKIYIYVKIFIRTCIIYVIKICFKTIDRKPSMFHWRTCWLTHSLRNVSRMGGFRSMVCTTISPRANWHAGTLCPASKQQCAILLVSHWLVTSAKV
jgi:hypothetical protein